MNKQYKGRHAKRRKAVATFIALACMMAWTGCSENTPSGPPVAEPFADTSAFPVESDTHEEDVKSLPDSNESPLPLAESSAFAETVRGNSSALASIPPIAESSGQKGDEAMPTVNIQAGSGSFTAVLYDNASAQALLAKLPLNLHMDELHGNEKYYYLSKSLPTDSQQVGSVHTGDLMLYGSDCLVLFYKSFSTSYSYTRIGYIKDVSGLEDALGSGSVQVTFSVDSQ